MKATKGKIRKQRKFIEQQSQIANQHKNIFKVTISHRNKMRVKYQPHSLDQGKLKQQKKPPTKLLVSVGMKAQGYSYLWLVDTLSWYTFANTKWQHLLKYKK